MGISAYGDGVFVSLFFEKRCSPDYFFRNVKKKWRHGFPKIKIKIKETMFIVIIVRYEIRK